MYNERMKSAGWKIRIGIFLTCLFFYLAFWNGKGVSVDGIVMFHYAKSLLFQRSLVMNPPVVWGQEFTVSHWPIGLTLAYMPFLWLLVKLPWLSSNRIIKIPYEAGVDFSNKYFNDPAYQYASLLHPLVTAISAVLVFELGRLLGLSNKKSIAAALVFGLASPAAVYTRFDYAQPLASMFILAAVVCVMKARGGSRLLLLLGGAAAGLAVLTRPETLIIPGLPLCLVVYTITPARDGQNRWFSGVRLINLLRFGIPLLLGVLAVLWWNDLRFGSWTDTGYSGEINRFVLLWDRFLPALVANLVSPGRGIFIFFPLSLLSVAGIFSLGRRDPWSGWLLGTVIAGSWLMYSAWYQWAAGISWGPRFLIPLMPYLAVLSWFSLDALKIRNPRIKGTIWLGLALLGLPATMQGMLFHPLRFYGLLNLDNQTVSEGLYHFLPQMSPVFSGWGDALSLVHYRNVWIESAIQNGSGWVYLSLLLLLLAACAWYWVRVFSRAGNN